MRYRAILLVLFAAAVSLLTSCAQKTEARREGCAAKVGIVFDIGGKNDRSFNAAAWEGVRRAQQDLPICLYDVEPGNPTSIEPAMRAFAERNFDLVIGVGFAQGPIMQKVAVDYPNIKFAIVDGVIVDKDGNPLPIVADLVFREHEGSYLVGMIAASKSKTGVVGFLGGMDIPLIHKFETGYAEGARSVNPNIKVLDNYVGVTDGAWNNPGKGKELSLNQIDKGADVIFTAAGNSGLGAFDAVEQYGRDPKTGEANKFVIGVDSNQNMVKPGFVLTSMVKRVDNAVYDVVKEVVEGKFDGGFHAFGLDKDGVAYAVDENNKTLIPQDVIQKVEDSKTKIVAGEIKVTDAMAK
ncbi:MAG TPA: BMP family ABC transporter substrate-binding protein [Pyrinomonadaceae bacterium]|nr:BMP family ABC transporter substrate-binding protein [Pyrinomonadaceae bacterium]